MKRAGPVVAAAIAAMLVLAPAASPAGSYTDPAGDNATAGDITGLTVSGDKSSGQLAFRLTGNLAISDTVPLLLFIDSDANPMTGNIMDVGADYIFAVGSDGYDFEHWNGVDWVDTPFATVRVFGSSQAITISVNKSEIGNTSDINFWAESFDSVGKKWDDAPNDGAFNYSLDSDGPLINSVDLQTEPTTGPKAGKKFVVTPTALHLPPDVELQQLLCSPRATRARRSWVRRRSWAPEPAVARSRCRRKRLVARHSASRSRSSTRAPRKRSPTPSRCAEWRLEPGRARRLARRSLRGCGELVPPRGPAVHCRPRHSCRA